MTEEELRNAIETGLEGASATVPRKGRLVATMPKAGAPLGVTGALIFLKARGFEHLSAISCTDWLGEASSTALLSTVKGRKVSRRSGERPSAEEGELELVYHLWSYRHKIHVMLKARLPRDGARAVTASPVFGHAQTYEREIHEMYGVVFEGNARLTPFLLDHWQGPPPMRRDFDTRQYVQDTFGTTPSVEE